MAGLELCVVPSKPAAETLNNMSMKKDKGIISVTAALELTSELHSKLNNNTRISGPIAAYLLGLAGKLPRNKLYKNLVINNIKK